MDVNRLGIGTAQFGLDYGVSNDQGQVSRQSAKEILDCAHERGIDILDTAVLYGESETRLGDIAGGRWRIVSKLPPVPEECVAIADWAESEIVGSLRRLKVAHLHGLLLHKPDQLLGPRGKQLFEALCSLRDMRLVQKIGVSVYHPAQLSSVLSSFPIDIVQAPVNVLDRRIVESGWLPKLATDGVELHARSVFLQGLLLMNARGRTAFGRWGTLWTAWDRWLNEVNLSALEVCIRYVLSFVDISYVIVGVTSRQQLEDILAACNGPLPEIPAELRSDDVDLINPSNWCDPQTR